VELGGGTEGREGGGEEGEGWEMHCCGFGGFGRV
jgi:hypothetical protein